MRVLTSFGWTVVLSMLAMLMLSYMTIFHQ